MERAYSPAEPYDKLYKGIQHPDTIINKDRIYIRTYPSSEGTRYYFESGEKIPGSQVYYDPARGQEIYLSNYQVRRIRAMRGPLTAKFDQYGTYNPWEK